MSLKAIEDLIKISASTMQTPVKVGVGRGQEINKFSQEDVLLWYIPASKTGEPIGDSNRIIYNYSIEIFFFFSDLASNNDTQTNTLINEAGRLSDNFLISFLDNLNSDDYNTGSLTGINTDVVYKFSSKGLYSGVVTTFSLSLPDDFVYCLPLDC